MHGIFRINGKDHAFSFDPQATLLTLLRENGFTEVKEGCREGCCGACLVLLEDRLVNSCQVFAGSAIGKNITTVRGIGSLHSPHIIQEAFAESGAVQCGFCTPGMVLACFYLLKKNPHPSDEEIKRSFRKLANRST